MQPSSTYLMHKSGPLFFIRFLLKGPKGTFVFDAWKVNVCDCCVLHVGLQSIRSTEGRFPSCWPQTNLRGRSQHIWTDCMRFILGIPKTSLSAFPTHCHSYQRRWTAHNQRELWEFLYNCLKTKTDKEIYNQTQIFKHQLVTVTGTTDSGVWGEPRWSCQANDCCMKIRRPEQESCDMNKSWLYITQGTNTHNYPYPN